MVAGVEWPRTSGLSWSAADAAARRNREYGGRELPLSEPIGRNEEQQAGRRCDFCGDRVVAVRRVALDREYDRLQKLHNELYACAICFETKERQRLGLAHR